MTKSSLLSEEKLYNFNDVQLYQLSINGKTKVLKKQINKEMKRREKLVTGRKKKK